MYEENKDPGVLDGLILLVDLLIYHLNQLDVDENIVYSIADSFAALSNLRDESDQLGTSCGVQIGFEADVSLGQLRSRPLLHRKRTT